MMKGKDKGSALLLEMLIVSAIMLTLLAVAMPSSVRLLRDSQQNAARARLILFEQLTVAYNTCTLAPPASGCPAPYWTPSTGALSVVQGGYTFTYSPGTPPTAWTVTAVPLLANVGQQLFYLDSSMILRCGANNAAPAC
jgi:type II secretory pathway pseudopilin PulG